MASNAQPHSSYSSFLITPGWWPFPFWFWSSVHCQQILSVPSVSSGLLSSVLAVVSTQCSPELSHGTLNISSIFNSRGDPSFFFCLARAWKYLRGGGWKFFSTFVRAAKTRWKAGSNFYVQEINARDREHGLEACSEIQAVNCYQSLLSYMVDFRGLRSNKLGHEVITGMNNQCIVSRGVILPYACNSAVTAT